MQRFSLITAVIALLLITNAVQGQQTCKVLLPRIAALYTGPCKRGLADGKGEASGVDKYVGEKALAPYVIGYRSNVGRMTFMKMDKDKFYVRYKFSRSGGESASAMTINDLLMQGSSGTENQTYNFTGFENVTFPFEGKLKFLAPNMTATANLSCEVRLTINEPGGWIVTIFY